MEAYPIWGVILISRRTNVSLAASPKFDQHFLRYLLGNIDVELSTNDGSEQILGSRSTLAV